MRIGIYSPNWIGDAVMALPFIEQLRIKYQKAEIIIFCKKWVSAVYENHSAIDRVISVSGRELRGPISTIRAGLELRAEKLDVFYTLTDSIRSAFIMWLSGSNRRYGYRSQMRSIFLTDVFYSLQSNIHRSNKYLNMLGGEKPDKVLPKIHLSKKEVLWARKKIVDLGLDNPIALLPFSVARSRTVPNFLIKDWIDDSKRDYLLFGSGRDIDNAKELISICTNNSIRSVCGKYSIRKSIALISQCDHALAADSGLGHIAASLDIPTISFFGAGMSAMTGPIGLNTAVIDKNVECSPCRKNDCTNIEDHLLCLKNISRSDIENAVNSFTNQ